MFDHLVISCEKLSDGQDWAEKHLGVPFQPGGKHELFGTHNVVLGLGERRYIEIIAPDPDAPDPLLQRWFGLDRFRGRPRLTHWACRTDDLEAFLDAVPEAGRAMPLSRGDLRWMMAVTISGFTPCEGLFPAMLEWQGPHPADRLPDSGCRLKSLNVSLPRAATLIERLNGGIVSSGDPRGEFDVPEVTIEIGKIAISAEIETPNGVVAL